MKLLLPIVVLLVIFGGYFFVNQIQNQQVDLPSKTSLPTPSPQDLKTFKSKNLKFDILYPRTTTIEEKSSIVDLNSAEGSITISRNGTNYSNLEDFLRNSDETNKVKVLTSENLQINNYEAVVRKQEFTESEIQKVYSIYVDNWVYSISTSTKSLYDVLDEIAQSFRYMP